MISHWLFCWLWLADLYIVQGIPHIRYIMGSRDQWGFPPVFRPHWQSPCTALTTGLPLGLCKGTVKESIPFSSVAGVQLLLSGSGSLGITGPHLTCHIVIIISNHRTLWPRFNSFRPELWPFGQQHFEIYFRKSIHRHRLCQIWLMYIKLCICIVFLFQQSASYQMSQKT